MTLRKYILPFILTGMQLVFGGNHPTQAEKISQILKEIPSATSYGILVLDPLSNDTIYMHNPKALMIPASVTKLYTTLSAVTTLGNDFLLSTKLYSSDYQLRDGIIDGDLYLKGYGNSLFTTDSLRKMVAVLKRMNIRKITGDIVGDETFFDGEYFHRDWIEDDPGGGNIPPISALVLNRNQTMVRKKVRRRRYAMVTASVKDPALHAASVLLAELQSEGISVDGHAVSGKTPDKTRELASSSVRLLDLMKVINKRSDNFLAECLFKTMGAIYSRKEGSAFYAGQALYQFLDRHDIVTDGLQIADGSGLSHYNLVSVRSIVSLLEWAYLNLTSFEEFLQSLSVAGDDGTLRNRMFDVPPGLQFYGKTGTLSGLSSIAGYLRNKNGNDLIIAMIFDYGKFNARYYKNIQDRIIKILAGNS
ncbi:MAG: D-alanyl-D-alanine carboxypeptidase/D-alanyl-D-alanine-endopeptidase [Ignavibacteriales bacterium]|nr:D-alanyl-D-alanine carboxypeptidase/D-alanyl-D-alanine-endopeptidase [Ignavibacteriales bacterium]